MNIHAFRPVVCAMVVGVLGLTCGVGVARAEVVVTAADGLDLTNSTTLASDVFRAEDGAVIRVTVPADSQPGFAFRKMEGTLLAWELERPLDSVRGQDCGSQTNLVFDAKLEQNLPMGVWVYQGRWRAPRTGNYSFMASIDDRASLLIDGRSIVVSDGNVIRTAQDVWLAEGWHDIEIKFVNIGLAFGPWPGVAKGLVWSPDNVLFTRENAGEGQLFEDPGDGSQVRTTHNGMFCRRLDIPSGTATLDLTQSGLAGPFCFGAKTGLRTGEGAKLLVRGGDALYFDGEDAGGVHFPLLDADVEFEGNADGKVYVDGKVSIERMRPNYVIEDGSEVAYWGEGMFTGEEWRLENRSACLLNTAAVDPATRIVLAGDSYLTLKPCQHHPDDSWLWQGISGVFPHDFEFADAEARMVLRDFRRLELTGRISGPGVIRVIDSPTEGPTILSGDLTGFTGIYTVADSGWLALKGALPPEGVPEIRNGVNADGSGGTVEFWPEGVGEVQTEVRVQRLWGCQEAGYLYANAQQDVRIASFSGMNGLKTANLTDSRIIVEGVDPGSTLVLRWTANVVLETPTAAAKVVVLGTKDQPGRLELGEGCDLVGEVDVRNMAVLNLCGTGLVARVTGTGTVIVGKDVQIGSLGPGVLLRMEEGAALRDNDPVALAAALGTRPALWLDASRADTMQQYLNCVFTNGVVIRRWNDCRPEQTALYGLNPRGEGYTRVYPYVMTNALNGMDIVSMGAVGGQVESKYGHVNVATGEQADPDGLQPETRRLPFNRPIKVRTAIVVFGSQFGGGGTILGGDMDPGANDLRGAEANEWVAANTACRFRRGGAHNAGNYRNASTPIFETKRNTWVDGCAVDPTTTGYGGGWQIVSFESATEEGEEVRSLGMIETYADSGGQNYAEVLLYTNALTTAERRAVEIHLARKWGLSCGSLPLNGAGHVEVADLLPAEGAFAGTVNLAAGARLDLGAASAPQTEADVPEEGRLGWFDPDDAASLVLAGASEPGLENCIYGIFDRGKEHVYGTPYLQSMSGRRPRAIAGAHGDGPVRTWVQFYEPPETWDKGGNTLRVKIDPAQMYPNPADYSYHPLMTRTAFIVSDSVYGGGVPISDVVSTDGLVKRRAVDNPNSPIWAEGTTASITNGLTRLNGLNVNGRTTGFTGGPELLSFTTTNDFPAAFFGSCANAVAGDYNEKSFEVLGEILLYDRVLVGEERDAVERYLTWKWLGRLPGGWCDWSRATVSGAGTVAAPSREWLPSFDAAFAGTLDLAAEALAFHVDAEGVVTDALALPSTATLNLPAAGAIDVAFADRPVTCVLAKAGVITGFDLARWTVNVSPETTATYRLVCEGGELRLDVQPAGTVLFVR